MNVIYSRRIRFADTDAAGVVYFPNYLSICHEAYEETLLNIGIDLNRFFNEADIIIPISRAEADFLRPVRCGDLIEVEISPERLKESEFALKHKVFIMGPVRKLAANVRTEHVCIDAKTRRRIPVPEKIAAWTG